MSSYLLYIYLSNFMSSYLLYIYLSIYPILCLVIYCISIYLSIYPILCLVIYCISIYPFIQFYVKLVKYNCKLLFSILILFRERRKEMLSAREFWSKKQFTDTESIQSYVQTRYRGMYTLDTEVC